MYSHYQVVRELEKRGAKTFGSYGRAYARLQRFLEYERKQNESKNTLQQAIREEQEKVATRLRLRAAEIENGIQYTSNTRSQKCHVRYVILTLALALTTVGAWLNSSRQIEFNL